MMTASFIDVALRLQCPNARCLCQKAGTNGNLIRHCPAHDDEHPSLSLSEGKDKVLWKCQAGCSQEEVTTALQERGIIGSASTNGRSAHPSTRSGPPQKVKGFTSSGIRGDRVTNSKTSTAGLALEALADTKSLSPSLLRQWGVGDSRYQGVARVVIPYLDEEGNIIAVQYRHSLSTDGSRFSWRKGDRTCLYGRNKLKDIRGRGWVLLVEGASDVWTGWYHEVPALGLPGKSTWRAEWAKDLDGIDVYLWVEPEADDLITRVGTDVPGLKVIYAPPGIKDLSEAHLQGLGVAAKIEDLKASAVPAQDIIRLQAAQRATELWERAAVVLASPDPLDVVKAAIKASGYGGDLGTPLVIYLAATSRLLAMRPGAMPVHLLLLGPPSAGKSYGLKIVLGLLPEEAKHEIDAGSPRTLIYDDAPLEHRVLVFGESDSLPAGEDNPAASAVRNLAQDHYLHYAVTVRDSETGDFTVRRIEKPGPTVLITTSVKPLGGQLMTRLFTLDVSGDADQVRAAVAMQVSLELEGAPPLDATLVDFQAYLQALAPWEVVIPFVAGLGHGISQSTAAPRILRDLHRLLSLIKAVAVLRHQARRRDPQGRLIATVDDYRTVYELVSDIFAASVTGLSEGVTNLVTKVEELRKEDKDRRITYSLLSQKLGVHRDLIRRRANTAVRNGWLVNQETRKNHTADLILGEPMPEMKGLPHPDTICHPVTPDTDGNINTFIYESSGPDAADPIREVEL